MERQKFLQAVEINRELVRLIEHIDEVKNKKGDEFGFIYVKYDGKENPIAKMMIGILSTLSEFELTRIKERQLEGIAKKKNKGGYIGRAEGSIEPIEVFMNKAKTNTILKHLKNGESIRRTALLSKCSVSLVQKVVKLQTEL